MYFIVEPYTLFSKMASSQALKTKAIKAILRKINKRSIALAKSNLTIYLEKVTRNVLRKGINREI